MNIQLESSDLVAEYLFHLQFKGFYDLQTHPKSGQQLNHRLLISCFSEVDGEDGEP